MIYAHSAGEYWAAGWRGVLPLPVRRKFPPPTGFTGHDGLDPSWPDVQTWMDGPEAKGNIAIRVPRGVLGIDVDTHNAGQMKAWQSLCDEIGCPPDTFMSTSKTDGSGIKWYRVPEDWNGADAFAFGETVQHWHRYAVVPPSVHPSGEVYRWVGPDGQQHNGIPQPTELPELPAIWLERLGREHRDKTAGSPQQVSHLTQTLAGGQPDAVVSEALVRAVEALQDTGSRHAAARDGSARLVRLGEQGHAGVPAALKSLGAEFVSLVGNDRPDASGEWDRFVLGALQMVAGSPTIEYDSKEDYEADARILLGGSQVAGEGFWSSRGSLRRVEQAAHARRITPAALLGALLPRVAAWIPRWVVLPALRGSHGSLDFATGLVGGPGGGKDSGMDVAEELWPLAREIALQAGSIGSGEGIAKALGHHEMLPDASDPDGKRKAMQWVWSNDRHASLFTDGEISAVEARGNRSGSTLIPLLCAAIHGKALRTSYSDREKNIDIGRLDYRFAAAFGIQPGNARWIVDAEATGLPQRIVWFDTRDPLWEKVIADEPIPFDLPVWPTQRQVVGVPAEVVEQVEQDAMQGNRGTLDPKLAHRTLNQIRVAYLLRAIDCVHEGKVSADDLNHFTIEDWELAGRVMQSSLDCWQGIWDELGKSSRQDAISRGQYTATVQVSAEDHASKIYRREIAERIIKAIEAKGEMKQREIRYLFSGNSRKTKMPLVPEVLDDLVDRGVLVRYPLGKTRAYRLAT